MGDFEKLSRELGHTFNELETARGAAKRRCFRKAHLLLLLADEMIVEAETEPSPGEPAAGAPPFNDDVAGARALLRSFAEGAVRSAERGPCRGLQTVLVLRKRPDRSRNPQAATGSLAQRAQS